MNKRYRQMQKYISIGLLAAAVLFIIYLFAAGYGVIWLKVISAIAAALPCICALALLHVSQELLKSRSLWMTAAAAAIIVCLLFSLILNFPCPRVY